MSRRRYLSTRISTDTKVNRLAVQHGDFAALLYTWLIPHAEDDGTLPGDPDELLMMILPGRRDKDAADVAAALAGMHELGLIVWERGGTHPAVQFPAASFYSYQTYIPGDKRRRSPRNAEDRRETPRNTASPSPSPSPSLSPSHSDPQGEMIDDADADRARARARARAKTTAATAEAPASSSQNATRSEAELGRLVVAVCEAADWPADTMGAAVRTMLKRPAVAALCNDDLVGGTADAREWYAEPDHPPFGVRRLYNWLTDPKQRRRITAPPAPSQPDPDPEPLPASEPEIAPPPPVTPLPSVSLAGYREDARTWRAVAAELRKTTTGARFDTVYGGTRLMLPPKPHANAPPDAEAAIPALVLHSRAALEQSDRDTREIAAAFQAAAPHIASLRRVCAAQIVMTEAEEQPAACTLPADGLPPAEPAPTVIPMAAHRRAPSPPKGA